MSKPAPIAALRTTPSAQSKRAQPEGAVVATMMAVKMIVHMGEQAKVDTARMAGATAPVYVLRDPPALPSSTPQAQRVLSCVTRG